jgi:hypothetical protein
MKVLFLDIDGVINSVRTAVANGGYPFELEEQEAFDQVAIKLIRGLCRAGDVKIVLSSAWRLYHAVPDVAAAFDLPLIGKTKAGGKSRGHDIQAWLDAHPEVTAYAIVDDTPHMLESQADRFVQTDPYNGLAWKDFEQLCKLFDVPPWKCKPRDQEWRAKEHPVPSFVEVDA